MHRSRSPSVSGYKFMERDAVWNLTMAMDAGEVYIVTAEKSLKETPTWAVAIVCTFFVVVSAIIDHSIHSLGQWFQRRHNKAMSEALEKIKAELMLMGFISLLIAVGAKPVSKICIPVEAGETMLPCKKSQFSGGGGRRKLLWGGGETVRRRALVTADGDQDYCSRFGRVSLISQSGVHQLHIFIFVLAVFHVLYSVITMALAQAKMKKWKSWELETTSLDYQIFANDPSRFRFTHQTSFVRQHSGFSSMPCLRWIVAFYRQFFDSVTEVDYLTIRHGFISAHFAPNSNFDFHKYIKKSMEDDFQVVVGISVPLWILATIFQLLNVYRWYTLFVISFMPPAILLIVGAKLEIIIMEMAQRIQERSIVVKGAPVVEPSDNYFWFNRPDLILVLIHFTLFENAFQMAYFLWTWVVNQFYEHLWYEFGITSCFHENLPAICAKVLLGIAFQVLCSYITFPLYALVTQMGSNMKRAIFEEETTRALNKWHKAAKERKKKKKPEAHVKAEGGGRYESSSSSSCSCQFMSLQASSCHCSSPAIQLFQTYKFSNPSAVDDEEAKICQAEIEIFEIGGPAV